MYEVAGALPTEHRESGRYAKQDSLDVDVDHRLPILDGEFVERTYRHRTGVAEEHIQSAKPFLGKANELLEVRTLADVRDPVSCFMPGGLDVRRQCRKGLVMAGTQDHLCAAVGQVERCRASDSAAGSRYCDHFAVYHADSICH